PEQCRGDKALDHRADLYALGVVLFRALTGTHPFDAQSYPQLILQIATAHPRPVTDWRADVPPALAQLVARLLAKHPEHRPQSCAEVEQALLPFVNDARPPALVRPERGFAKTAPLPAPVATAPLASAPGPTPAPNRSRLWLAIAALSAVLAALLGAAVVVLPWQGAPREEPDEPAPVATTPPAPAPPVEPGPPPSPVASDAPHGAPMPPSPQAPLPSVPSPPTAPPAVAPALQPAPPRTPVQQGTLTVTAIPTGTIWIDNQRRGEGSVTRRLDPGTHRVGVGRTGAFAPSSSTVVRIEPGQHHTLRLRP
ncbi:MAG: hypothetical protein IT378_24575, partial [Sandaracinaceae bacterium]|nr:hypothetical protein [Sandaracinaceae bacterium]